MVPPHGDRCLTEDLGPSTFIAMTIDLPTPSTMQVPRVGKPSGTTDPKATDHGSQRGYCAQPPHPKSHGKQASPPSSGGTVHGPGLKSWGGGFIWMGFCLGNRNLTLCSQSVSKFQNSRGGKVKNWLAPDLTTLKIKSMHHRAYDNVFFLISKTCLQFPR